MSEIRPVTKDNWKDLIRLKVREDQTHFVAPNLYSIAEGQFGDDYEGHWDLHPFGIYDDGGTPVGFLMYGFNFEHPKQRAFIIRLMVDEKHQAKVLGDLACRKCSRPFAPTSASKPLGLAMSQRMKPPESFMRAWVLRRQAKWLVKRSSQHCGSNKLW
jgi:hypothetical protein